MFGRKVRGELALMLDQPPSYHPGDTISGQVTFSPQQDIESGILHVGLQWATQGTGDVNVYLTEKVSHEGETFRLGLPIRLDFRFTAPALPWSYQGESVSIVWHVVAEAGRPKAEGGGGIQLVQETTPTAWMFAGKPLRTEEMVIISPTGQVMTPPQPPMPPAGPG